MLYTDTDSLIYDVKSDDIYKFMGDNIEKFDTSDYPDQNIYQFSRVNKKIPDLMKDEFCF